ncbi:VOC family protein [Streptomyces sp. NBC_00201]|uniref:VOC family protein n=1 Tax=unclassified Streptomyces TaxID=2593676 RepID=UPI002255E442|nr:MULTISPECIES: VOC family protein [unclassified Streptomyces]MCX5056044.1 VOC family protein [Streptomyces sp. NBC_00452]MCX5247062.1 VOC family protein [Streptomyces sp. NBC_00201]MCX5287148.1 VOC family protein [Streptomyces sp. NBC_00183]
MTTSPKLQLTIDCADPERLARFWATALGYKVEPPPAPFATWRAYWLGQGLAEEELGEGDCSDSVIDPDGVGPRIWFQQVPEGKVVKNRLHLDLGVGGGRSVPFADRKERVLAEVARLETVGASRLRMEDSEGSGSFFAVMHDPEDNEFCVH